MKETKRALLLSGLSLALCFLLMSGMTFAWFTDSVINKGNNITAGTLVVDLLLDKGKNGTYESIANSEKKIFSDGSGENGDSWEPGKTEVVFLAVRNNGQLDLAYNIDLAIEEDLATSLEYALIPGVKKETFMVSTWEDIKKISGAKTGDATNNICFDAKTEIKAGGDSPMSYFALAIHMKEDASNQVQGKSAVLNLTVNATQITVNEKDELQP